MNMGSQCGTGRGQHWSGRAGRRCAAIVTLAVAAVTVAACTSNNGTATTTGNAAAGLSTSGPGAALQDQYQSVVKSVLPSVVQIETGNSTGSGVVYDKDGNIVTNAHVVGTAQTVQVHADTSSSTLEARVVGTFQPDDLAIIRVTSGADSLHPAHFGKSADIATGQIVMAMGSPLGLTGTVTQGIISATGRTVSEASASGGTPTTIANALQTSAAINGGNSGGALVDLGGHVIGIPTAAAQTPGTGALAAGIGFAVPSDTVTNIAGQLISTGKVENSGRAALGIQGRDAVSPSGEPGGVTVTKLTPGGWAEKAGLHAGDVIIAVNDAQTPSTAALTALLANYKPGDKVTVTYVRDNAHHTAEVTLGNLSSP
jgi:S1-C subfamily serine protease